MIISFVVRVLCQVRRIFPLARLWSKTKIIATILSNISLYWWKYRFNTILIGYLTFEITCRWYGHAHSSSVRNLCVNLLCFVVFLSQVNSDYISKSCLTGVKEIMQLLPYHQSHTKKNKDWYDTQHKTKQAKLYVYASITVPHDDIMKRILLFRMT